MTFLQPKKNFNILSKAVFLIVIPIVAGVVWLVMLYSQAVDVEHDIATLDKEIEAQEAKNTEIKEEIFKLLSSDNVDELSQELGLVEDKSPQYFKNKAWEFALHQ